MFRTISVMILLSFGALPAWTDCPLELRSYEDVEGRRMALEFDPPSRDRGPAVIAVAKLRVPDRGEVGRYEVVARPGYGDVLLVSSEGEHSVYFFTEDLRSVKTAEGSRLLFIEGLGLADWAHGETPGSREYPVGDVVWQLAGCKE